MTETTLNRSWADRDAVPSTGHEHYYGHDDALIGDAGAIAFIGADEIAKKQRQQQQDFMNPVTSNVHTQIQRELLGGYDDQRAVLVNHTSAAPVAGGAGADTQGSPPDWVKDHHLGRDGTMIEGVTGLLGAGALYEGEKQHDTTAEIQQPGNDPEYVKTLRSHGYEHELEKQNLTPELSHTRKNNREHKRGGLLGKILRRKDKVELQGEPAVADDDISSPISPKRNPANARGLEDTVASVGTGAVDADEPKRHSSERKKHSPKPSGEFSHLGRNKLHKDPPPKYFQQHHTADSSESDSLPALSSTMSPERHTDAEGLMGDPYANSELVDRPVSGFGTDDEYMGVVSEPHMGLAMNVGDYGTDFGRMDRNTSIEGYHGQGEGYGPVWENVRNVNTLY